MTTRKPLSHAVVKVWFLFSVLVLPPPSLISVGIHLVLVAAPPTHQTTQYKAMAFEHIADASIKYQGVLFVLGFNGRALSSFLDPTNYYLKMTIRAALSTSSSEALALTRWRSRSCA